MSNPFELESCREEFYGLSDVEEESQSSSRRSSSSYHRDGRIELPDRFPAVYLEMEVREGSDRGSVTRSSCPANVLPLENQFHGKMKRGNHSRMRNQRQPSLTPATSLANAKRGSILQPFQKVALSWDKVDAYEMFLKKKRLFVKTSTTDPCETRKQILKDITGFAAAGELIGILGPRGSGKTTLLNALTGDTRKSLAVEGKIYVNNQLVDQNMARYASFVPVHDCFSGSMTVLEHLTFHALLRLDQQYSQAEKRALVRDIIAELDLEKISDKIIGIPTRLKGLSAVDRRRLSFATAAITNPAVLLCDEPTDGLDIFAAEAIIEVLKTASTNGKIVICSLQNPTSDVLAKVDQILVLCEGQMVFFGKVKEAAGFFTAAGFPCPSLFNPADHFLRVLSQSSEQTNLQRQKIKNVRDRYRSSEAWYNLRHKVETTAKRSTAAAQSAPKKLSSKSSQNAGWFFQLMMLCWRSYLQCLRDPLLLKSLCVFNVYIGLFFGITYAQQDMDQHGVGNINGVLCLLAVYVSSVALYGVTKPLTQDLRIIHLDIKNNIYSASAYFLGKVLVDACLFFFLSLLLITICYWIIGLYPSAQAYVLACCLSFLTTQASVGLAYILSIVTGRVKRALPLLVAALIPTITVGGYFMNIQSIPAWLKGLAQLSWFRYAMEGVMINQWLHVEKISCNNGDYNVTCLNTGHEVIRNLGFQPDNLTLDCVALICIGVVFRVIAFLLLLKRFYW